MVKYPSGPPPTGKELKPGEGINSNPLNCNENINYTGPMGSCTQAYYGISFQLGKWGFQTFKINESIFVSQISKGYYELVVKEKEQLLQQIKASLMSISEAYADLELILHDLRKYKQYVEYFERLDKIKAEIEKEKDEEKKKKLESEKISIEQTLRSIFIDQVDIHTDLPNTPIALRSIVGRWPTIISDFMKLGEEKSPEEIKLDVSYAEKVVLATKNKLFLEWKKMFSETVRERYRRLRELAEARKNSLQEYKNAAKPLIARYKMIVDALSSPAFRRTLARHFLRPDAQALSIDSMTIWAWKPFAPSEKWKISYERVDKVSPEKAGFTREEIEELKKANKIDKSGMIDPLPMEPSIDDVVRKIKAEIEKEYGVTLTALDLFEARERLLKRYSAGPYVGAEGPSWPFSPYFVFAELPMERVVLIFPDGSQLEDLTIQLKTYVKSQNIIIGHILEIIAKEKKLEYEIGSLLGEFGIDSGKWKEIDKIIEDEFGKMKEGGKEGKVEKKEKSKESSGKDVFGFFSKISNYFGLDLIFIRAHGPYEFVVSDRLTKYYLKEAARAFSAIKNYFDLIFGVPGAKSVGFV